MSPPHDKKKGAQPPGSAPSTDKKVKQRRKRKSACDFEQALHGITRPIFLSAKPRFQITDKEISELSLNLLPEMLADPDGRKCIAELKALADLNLDLMVKAVFVAGATIALKAIQKGHRPPVVIRPEDYPKGDQPWLKG